MQKHGIYVHVPFCSRKCQYCDFHSIVADETFVGRYFSAFKHEIQARGQAVSGTVFDTLFIGGGTPSTLSEDQLTQLLGWIRENFCFGPETEATMEVNPSSLTRRKLEIIRSGGINRLSMGVQAFQNRLLRQLGRVHTTSDAEKAVYEAKSIGFDSISMDLMFGLPGQSVSDWQQTLARAVDLGVNHISAYSLILEEGTAFHRWAEKGLLQLPDEDEEVGMFETAMSYLPNRGLLQYEISNYAQPGHESRHNSLYWTGQPYLAVGSGAVGSWQGRRYRNTKNFESYVEGWLLGEREPLDYEEWLTPSEAMDEFMMTGLRLLSGVSASEFERRFDAAVQEIYPRELEHLLDRKLIEWADGGFLRLTKRGILLGNVVFSEWLRDR